MADDRPPLESFIKRPPLSSFQASDKPAPAINPAMDFLKSVPGGVVKGLGEAATGLGQAASVEMGQPEMQATIPTTEQFKGQIEKMTGPLPAPQGRAGKIGESAGEFLGNPASYVGPGGMGAKALTAATAGAGAEILGQLFEGTKVAPYARIVGGMAGGMIPSGAARAVTPLPIKPERAKLVQDLRAEGVEPTAGDVSGRRSVKYGEAALGSAPGAGGAYDEARQNISEQFTRAALTRIGETATEASPQVVDRAFTRIGNQFDALAERNTATYDTQYVTDLINALDQYEHLVVDPMTKPAVQHVFDSALKRLSKGNTMDGSEYKSFTSSIERMRRGTKDPEVKMFLAEAKDAVDNLMERSIQQTNPADIGAWKEIRNQYRNALVIERAATGAGGGTQISPSQLRQATVSMHGRRNYARGSGDFSTLAHAGDTILKPPPTSGTSERAWMHAIPAAAGAVLGGATGGAVESIPGAIAGMMAPGLTGRAIMHPLGQAYLKNQVAAGVIPKLRYGGRRGLASATMFEIMRRRMEEDRRRNLYQSTE